MPRTIRVTVGDVTASSTRADLVAGVDEPNASNTGVLAGTTLTTLTGNQTITTAGTVIQDKDIFGKVNIQAANVVIKNCRIRGANDGAFAIVQCTSTACVNAQIIDCDIVADFPTDTLNGIYGHDFTALRCNIRDTVDCIRVNNTSVPTAATGVTVQQCYLHHMAVRSPTATQSDNVTHNDCVQIESGSGLVMLGNSVHAESGSATASDAGGLAFTPWPTCCLMVTPNVGAISAMDIQKNWIYGGRIAVNAGADSLSTSNLGKIWQNRFDRSQYYAGHTIDIQAGTTWDAGEGTGNQNVYMDNGAPVTVRRNA